MTLLGICLRIYYNILNFRLCTICLSLILLIAQIENLRIVIFLIKRQTKISSLPISLGIGLKSFGIILLSLLRLWCFGSFCISVCLLIWMLREMCFSFVLCALYVLLVYQTMKVFQQCLHLGTLY